MRTWMPDAEYGLRDAAALASRFVEGVDAMLEQIAPDLRDVVMGQLNAAEEGAVLHPDLFDWYYGVKASYLAEDEAKVRAAGDRLPSLLAAVSDSRRRARNRLPVLSIAVDIDGARYSTTVTRAEKMAESIHGQRQSLEMVKDYSDEEVRKIGEAFALMREIWPEAHQELGQFIQQVNFFNSTLGRTLVIGFADIVSHGAIFLRRDDIGDSVTLAEEMLHEASHVRLNALLSTTTLFLNDETERYATPLRQDPRPMFGLFHQMWVLSRLLHFYRAVTKVRDGHEEKLKTIHASLVEAWGTVDAHAKLTDEGRSIVSSIRELLS